MENIITKFQTIYNSVRTEKGSFTLFMILKMDEYTDKWSILISAPWITQDNKSEIFKYLAGIISSKLTQQEVTTIARLGLFLPNEHLVTLFTGTFRVQANSAPIKLVNTKVNGYQVHEAYIYESSGIQLTS